MTTSPIQQAIRASEQLHIDDFVSIRDLRVSDGEKAFYASCIRRLSEHLTLGTLNEDTLITVREDTRKLAQRIVKGTKVLHQVQEKQDEQRVREFEPTLQLLVEVLALYDTFFQHHTSQATYEQWLKEIAQITGGKA